MLTSPAFTAKLLPKYVFANYLTEYMVHLVMASLAPWTSPQLSASVTATPSMASFSSTCHYEAAAQAGQGFPSASAAGMYAYRCRACHASMPVPQPTLPVGTLSGSCRRAI